MPTISPFQLTQYSTALVDIYAALEQEVFLRMAELLVSEESVAGDLAIQWQVEKLQQLRLFNAENIKALAEIKGVTEKEIRDIFARVGYDTIETVDEQVARLGLRRLSMPTDLDSLLAAYVDGQFANTDNFVNLRLIDSLQREGTATEVFKRVIEESTARAITGNITVNAAVAQTITKWRDRGIPSGFVDKGGRRWDIQNYIDTSIRTTANNAYNQLTENRMNDYDIHLVRVDFYRGARPTCARIQGGVASYRRPGPETEGYPSLYEFGYGDPTGIRGINCRHRLTAFVDGLSTNNNENVPDVTEANEYYKLTQKQRALERRVRDHKRNLELVEVLGDKKQIAKQKELIRNAQANVREFVADNDLVRRYDKERVL